MAKIISTREAVDHISQTSDNETDVTYPYFFVVGAGISAPAIPVAGTIVSDCCVKLRDDDRKLDNINQAAPGMDKYTTALEATYPNKQDRRRLFESLTQDGYVTPACMLMAVLLSNSVEKQRGLAQLVVTTNFDDYISRPLSLFGAKHTVIDGPSFAGSLTPLNADTAYVVHLHGTTSTYEMSNLKQEINSHSRLLRSFLDTTLTHHVPICLGYSGWESDIFMLALRERLNSGLPWNLLWFCYQDSDYYALPHWLREHPDVLIVVPNPDALTNSDSTNSSVLWPSQRGDPQINARALLNQDHVCAADHVLKELTVGLDIDLPIAIADPLANLRSVYKGYLAPTNMYERFNDPFGINRVLDSIEKVKREHESDIPSSVKRATNEIARRNFLDAENLLLDNDETKIREWNCDQRTEFVHAITLLFDWSGSSELRYDELYARIASTNGRLRTHSRAYREYMWSLKMLAQALVMSGEPEDIDAARPLLERAIVAASSQEDPTSKRMLAHFLIIYSVVLDAKDEIEEAIETLVSSLNYVCEYIQHYLHPSISLVISQNLYTYATKLGSASKIKCFLTQIDSSIDNKLDSKLSSKLVAMVSLATWLDKNASDGSGELENIIDKYEAVETNSIVDLTLLKARFDLANSYFDLQNNLADSVKHFEYIVSSRSASQNAEVQRCVAMSLINISIQYDMKKDWAQSETGFRRLNSYLDCLDKEHLEDIREISESRRLYGLSLKCSVDKIEGKYSCSIHEDHVHAVYSERGPSLVGFIHPYNIPYPREILNFSEDKFTHLMSTVNELRATEEEPKVVLAVNEIGDIFFTKNIDGACFVGVIQKSEDDSNKCIDLPCDLYSFLSPPHYFQSVETDSELAGKTVDSRFMKIPYSTLNRVHSQIASMMRRIIQFLTR